MKGCITLSYKILKVIKSKNKLKCISKLFKLLKVRRKLILEVLMYFTEFVCFFMSLLYAISERKGQHLR